MDQPAISHLRPKEVGLCWKWTRPQDLSRPRRTRQRRLPKQQRPGLQLSLTPDTVSFRIFFFFKTKNHMAVNKHNKPFCVGITCEKYNFLHYKIIWVPIKFKNQPVLYLGLEQNILDVKNQIRFMAQSPLDLQSLFGLHVHSLNHWLRPPTPMPHPSPCIFPGTKLCQSGIDIRASESVRIQICTREMGG